MQKPRSRKRRARTGKAEALTERDIIVLRTLSRYKYLRADFLASLDNSPVRAFSVRLRKLHRAGYIKRPPQQWSYSNCDYRFTIYELDKEGKEYLKETDQVQEPIANFKHLLNEFAHNVLLCDVLFSIEQGAMQKGVILTTNNSHIKIPATIFATLKDKLHTSNDPLDPDNLFTLSYPNGTQLHFFLEVDCGSEPVERDNLSSSSHLKKALQYKYVTETAAYKTLVPSMWIAVVTNVASRAERIRALYEKHDLNFSIFKTHPVLLRRERVKKPDEPKPDGSMFLLPWKRANGKPFQM